MILIHSSLHPQHLNNWIDVIKSKIHQDNVEIPNAYSKYISKEDVAFEVEDSKHNLIVIPE